MKKILSVLYIAALVVLSLGSCSKLSERIDNNDAEIAKIEAAIGRYTQLKSDITSVIQALTTELGSKPADEQATIWSCISTLKGQSATFDNAIKALETMIGDKPVSEQISSLVSTYQLEGLAASVSAIKDIVEGKGDTPSLAAQIAALKEKTDAIDGILARISALETMIQSITIFPAFDNGSVKIDENIVDLKIKVSPSNSINNLSELQLWEAIKVYVNQVETLTKSNANLAEAFVFNVRFIDKDQGLISLNADVYEYMPEVDDHSITVAVNIKNGISDHTSEFVRTHVVHTVAPDGFVNLGIRNNKGEHVFWANNNLGADKPEDAGDYYAWGSTEKVYSLSDSKFTFQTTNPDANRYMGGWNPEKGFNHCNTPYYNGTTYIKYSSPGELEPADDAANKANNKWYIPSREDFYDLAENCLVWWTADYNGKPGYVVYKAKNAQDRGKAFLWRKNVYIWHEWQTNGYHETSNRPVAQYNYKVDTHIFLPAAGQGRNLGLNYVKAGLLYWSRTKRGDDCEFAFGLDAIPEEGITMRNDLLRFIGGSIRPVCYDSSLEPDIPAGALSGTFTVNAEGRKVYFSKGNLWYDGYKFSFEEEQTCFRHYNGVNGDQAWLNSGFVTTTPENTVGSSFWSKKGSSAFAKDYDDPEAAETDVFFTNATETTAKQDFSVNIGGKAHTGIWRTLSKDEWAYLLFHNGSVWTSINGVKGRIIFCDGFAGDKNTKYTVIPEGCAFLPATGNRDADGVESTGEIGFYWSSSVMENTMAYYFTFTPDGVDSPCADKRHTGSCVRLVTDCQ